MTRLDLLAGLRVLELGDGVAGAAATSVLWALGADVTAAVDARSAHRRGRPAVGVCSLLARVLDRGKHLVEPGTLEDVVALLGAADLVVFDRVGGVPGALADVEAYVDFVDAHNPGAWVSISAFGLTGERAGDVATELTVAAASGVLAVAHDPRTGRPLKIAGQQSLLNAGQAAALAACTAFDDSRDGQVHLDLSAVEASIATGPVLQIGSVTFACGGTVGATRYGAPAGFYECADGMLRISAMEDHQWRGVVEAMGSPAWTTEFSTQQARMDTPEEIDARIEAWTRTLTKRDAEALLQRHGVPATGLYAPAEILESPQLAHRRAFEPLAVGDGREATIVGVPFLPVAARGEQRRRRSIRGLRVLEAGHVLAVPLCTALLGALGADVIKLEDVRRLDMYRRRGPFVDGIEGMERSAFFALMNHSKGSVAFDVDADRARLAAMVDDADVVIENLGGKRARALGLAAASLAESHPEVLALSSSGFGQDGPQAAYRAYAYNLQAACGFCYLTRNEHGETAEVDLAWADLISGYALATLVAAWAVGPAGNRGAAFDYAMADLISAHFNEFIAAASLDAHSDASVDRGNALAPYGPHDVHPTADGWIAIVVDGDDVLAEEVVEAPQLVDVAYLAARGFFAEVDHPEWGRRRIVGLPWRRYGGSPIALRAAPVLGCSVH